MEENVLNYFNNHYYYYYCLIEIRVYIDFVLEETIIPEIIEIHEIFFHEIIFEDLNLAEIFDLDYAVLYFFKASGIHYSKIVKLV